jgi:short-subunit dehydrogenase
VQDFYRGRTALVTGASDGIGREMARQLSALGARVLLAARREGALEEVARGLPGEAAVFAADLQPPGAAGDLADRVAEEGETVDVLINNAGFGEAGPFLEHAGRAGAMVDLNCRALTELTARFLPGMVARGRGGVLNVASLGAYMPVPRLAVYAATKAFVRSFTEALSWELRGTGVHVTNLSPGPVRTGFADRAGMDEAFFDGALPADEVARQALRGLAADTRRVVPGMLTKLQVFAPRVAPVGLGLALTERSSRKAG